MKGSLGQIARALVGVCGLLLGAQQGQAQRLVSGGPDFIQFTATADSLPLPAGSSGFGVGVIGAERLPFEVVIVTPGVRPPPNFVTVTPSSGMAPTVVRVALNPDVVPYMLPGPNYGLVVSAVVPGQPSCPPSCAGTRVILHLLPAPPSTVGAVVSAASFQPTVSPGQIISIFGQNIGTPPLVGQPDEGGLFPKSLGNTRVTFNGIAAPLLYVSTTLINAVVPYGVAGQTTVSLQLIHSGPASFSVPVAPTAPALFTVTHTGRGQGAILNVDSRNPNLVTLNSAENPAPKGSIVTMFGTGAGLWNRTVPDGSVIPDASVTPVAPVSVTIGGRPAQILYAGAAPSLVSGVLQVNAVVPEGIGSGAQPVVLTIGRNGNAQQQVTVAVQ